MIPKTGRVDCKCGDQIISNSGKEISYDFHSKLVKCWNPECGGIYHRDSVYRARKENEVTVFDDSTDIKVFAVEGVDWVAAKSIEEAKKFYGEEFSTVGEELDIEEISLYKIIRDIDGDDPKRLYTARMAIDECTDFPFVIASTEW